MQAVIIAVISALSSGGVCSVIVYLLQRKDRKAEKELQISIDKLTAITGRLEKQEVTTSRIERALVAQMHHTIYVKCEEILTEYANGTRDCVDVDEFHDLSVLYQTYAELGGNGTGKILFERVGRLPLKQTNWAGRTLRA